MRKVKRVKEKGGGEEEKAKAAQAMFDPKADPAMGARMDREKAANDKLAQKDKEDSETGQSPSDKAAQDTIKQASDKANDTIKQASDKANAEFKDKADKAAKDKEAAKKKGYNDSLHAMSDTQLDAAINDAQKKMHNAQKSGDDKASCPHGFETRDYSAKIKDSILDCIGNTPLVRINNITKDEGIECEVLVKCEFMNPAGSVKDRIARRMILDAELNGSLK